MVTSLALPTSIGEIFSEGGITSVIGIGGGLLAGEFTGTLFQSAANVTGGIGAVVKFIGEVVAGGVLFFLGRRVQGAFRTFFFLAGVAAPAAIIPDVMVLATSKTAAQYAQVSALSLRQTLARSGLALGRPPSAITVTPQVVYNRTLGGGARVGAAIYSKTLG